MTLRTRLVVAFGVTSLMSLGGVAGGLHYAAAYASTTRALVWATVIAIVAALVWSVLITSWIVEGLTEDHRTIARAVRAFASGQLDTRVRLRSRDPEIDRLARDVDAMMVDLSNAMAVQKRFAASAAHELRSPLTTLHGELSLALRRQRSADEYRVAISHALEAATDLRALSEDLLDLARANARPTMKRVCTVDIATLARRAAERAQVRVALRNEPLRVRGDSADLDRLISNLIDNARHHSAAEESITVVAETADGFVRIAVEDEGVGIDARIADTIFEPFERGASGGTGLGLAICKSIAMAHGGSIGLDTERAKGARFVVTLPRQ
jgi:two-component system, OmpR family, sensor kinase